MKIKILKYLTIQETGFLTDLKPGEILMVDDELAEKLIEGEKAEFIF